MGHVQKFIEPVEREAYPLNLSDAQILDFLNEYVDSVTYTRPTPRTVGGFTLHVYDQKTTGNTLRLAACKAAAKWKELNK